MSDNLQTLLKNIEHILDHDTQLTDRNLSNLVSSMKSLDKKIKNRQKKQKISINKSMYLQVEKIAKSMGTNAQAWIESQITKGIQENIAVEEVENYDKWVEEESEKIRNKYNKKSESLTAKTDKYLLSKGKFLGHSIVDGNPIYDISDEVKAELENYTKIKEVSDAEISRTILGDEQKEIII